MIDARTEKGLRIEGVALEGNVGSKPTGDARVPRRLVDKDAFDFNTQGETHACRH